MNAPVRQPRTLLVRAFWLVLLLIVMAWMVQPVGAETLRTELYQFDALGSVSQSIGATPHVYMRVSNANRLISNPARPSESSSAEGTGKFALFEFFLDSESSDCSLTRVRFRNSTERQSPLGRLHSVCSSEQAGPLVSPDAGFVSGDLTVDLPGDGVKSGEVADLLFELSPGESINSLLDDRIAGGDLRPEVEVGLPDGSTIWAHTVRPINLSRGLPLPGNEVVAAGSCPPISIVPRINVAVVHTWAILFRDHKKESSAQQVTRKVPTPTLRGIRARAPPVGA